MKKILYAVILIGCGWNSIAQTLTTIYTPKGSAVSDTYIIPEFSASQIAAANSYVETNYPNATRLTNASATYNCHGYAWYMTSPNCGNNVWVGYSSATSEDIFWTDGSYTETNFQSSGMKVSYASDNHSAITTTTNNIFKSKWGQLPVMQHDKNYTPYNSSVLKYYIRNQIIGPATICTSGQFSASNQPAGTTITWSSSNPSGLSINASGLATRVNGFNGQVTVTATINSGCGSVTLPGVDVVVGTGLLDPLFEQKTVTCISSSQYSILARVTQAPGNVTYRWYIGSSTGSNYVLKNTTTSNSATVGGGVPDNLYYTLKVDVTNVCGTVSTAKQEGRFKASCSGGGGNLAKLALATYPNPATAGFIVELTDSAAIKLNDKITLEPYEVHLIDKYQHKIYSIKSSEKTLHIPTEGLPPDVYYLHLYYKDSIIRKQIVIRN